MRWLWALVGGGVLPNLSATCFGVPYSPRDRFSFAQIIDVRLRMSLTTLALVFTLGVLAHNVEEALYLPAWSVRAGRWHVVVGSNEFRFAVVLLSVALVCITAAASLANPGSPASYRLAGYVFAMVLNVVAPHGIATVAMRRYMPGTATAVLFNLPLGCLFLARALSEHFIQLEVFVWSAPLVAIAIVVSIPVLFAVGRKIQVEC